MSHGHHHRAHTGGNIKTAFFLNLGFAILEIIGGIYTNSVAILSDALHDFGDSLTLGVSWYFDKVSKREVDKKYSYGYKRFSLLGAIISSIVLITGSIFIVLESIPRLFNPVQPDTSGMIVLGIIGVLINGLAAFRLRKGHSINEKVVYLHLLEDVLGWVAVLIGATVMHFTDLPIIDPILSVLIAIFILYNVFKNLRQSFKIILQGTPPDLNLDQIHEAILSVSGVDDFHDCHTWTMDGEYHVLSIHLVVKNMSMVSMEKIKKEIKNKLKMLGIEHATIEFEQEGAECDPC